MEISRTLFYSLDQIQDAANETQDTNPIHQQHKENSPSEDFVSSPIVLGFQIATLIDREVSLLDVCSDSVKGRHCKGSFSNYFDIRYLRPVHPYESICITVKTPKRNTDNWVMKEQQKTNRFTLSGKSGAAVSGLRRTSIEQIDLPTAFACFGLKGKNMKRVVKPLSGFYHQREKIQIRAACRFLEASLGTSILAESASNKSAPIPRKMRKFSLSAIPKMYLVALSSKVLAKCPALADIDLNKTKLVYSRVRLHINDAVTHSIRDGDSVDYLVGTKSYLTKELENRSDGKRIVYVLATTKDRQLVFWGEFTLSLYHSL